MIVSFGDEGTEDIFHGSNTKAARKTCPQELWPIAARKLDLINAAVTEADLRVPPGNQFEHLKGSWKGWCSIRVNQQYRVVFKWSAPNAAEVKILDYH